MIYIRLHETEKGAVVAMCDEELIGKRLKEGKRELDLASYGEFYRGELVDKKTAAKMISKEAVYTANVVGEESLSVCIEKGLASRSDAATISGVPYLHIYKMI